MNKRELQSLARKKLGPRARVVFNPSAKTKKDRDEIKARVEGLKEREKELRRELGMIGRWDLKLLEAAEFVVDVDGDNPSIPQLREAVELGRKVRDMREEMNGCTEARKRLDRGLHRHRVEIHTIDTTMPGFPLEIVDPCGDTIEEVAEKLQVKPPWPGA